MSNSTARVVISHMLLLGQSVVSIRKVVASDSALELSNFFGVLLLGRVGSGGSEVVGVDTGVLWYLSHTMTPGLFAKLCLLGLHIKVVDFADLMGGCHFCQLSR